MPKLFYTLSILLVLLSASCKKDKEGTPEQKHIQLSKITTGGGGYYGYEYDANGRMQKQIVYNSSLAATTTWMFTYDAGGRLTGYTQDYTRPENDDYKYVLSYTANGDIEKIVRSEAGGSVTNSYKYTYSANGMALEQQDDAGAPQYKNEYVFNTGTKNIKEVKGYSYTSGEWQLQFHVVIENYDNKKSQYSLFPKGIIYAPQLLEFFTAMPFINNPLLVRDGTRPSYTANFTYEYNSDGYPTRCTFSDGADPTTHEYQYNYQ